MFNSTKDILFQFFWIIRPLHFGSAYRNDFVSYVVIYIVAVGTLILYAKLFTWLPVLIHIMGAGEQYGGM